MTEWRTFRDGSYEASSDGFLRRARPGIATFVGRPLLGVGSAGGYLQVSLCGSRLYVHRVIAEVFLGPCPDSHVVNHKDGNKQNNRIDNLEYVTARENAVHALTIARRRKGPLKERQPKKGPATGDQHWSRRLPERVARGERMGGSKLTETKVIEIRRRALCGEPQQAIAKSENISIAQISRIVRRQRWAHVGVHSMKCMDQIAGDGWILYHGDSVEVLPGLPDNSIDFSIFSPPFSSLYTYSASDRDLGNCRSDDEFFEHFAFIATDLLRVTKPGRNVSMHAMDLPTSKTRDGEIGLKDFSGGLIRVMQAAGFIWHSKVTIWKDPVTAMQRTKALGLLHKQIRKDSCMSRMGIPDYVLTFRKPGVNSEPVSHTAEEFPVTLWQRYASPVWDDIDPSDTLQYRSAREEEDERHICPLQLEVSRRCIRLWSNPGDTILSPFAGIGSEGFVALEEGRRFVGVELKTSYYEQARRNLASAEPKASGKQIAMVLT